MSEPVPAIVGQTGENAPVVSAKTAAAVPVPSAPPALSPRKPIAPVTTNGKHSPSTSWRSWCLLSLTVAVVIGSLIWLRSDQWDDPPGRIVQLEIEHKNRLGEHRIDQQPVAFLYCHLAQGNPRADEWQRIGRMANDEDRQLDATWRDWRDYRCLSPFADTRTYFTLSRDLHPRFTEPRFGALVHSAIKNTANVTTLMRPRVQETFIDAYGQLYYRVLIPSFLTVKPTAPTTLVPVMVSHLNILAGLTTWWGEIRARLGPLPAPCVCAAHFGIVGSGLHFTTNKRVCEPIPGPQPSEWTIWIGLTRKHVTESSGSEVTQQQFFGGWHAFPALTDEMLWPRTNDTIMSVPVASHFVGHDPHALYATADVESLGSWAKSYPWKLDVRPKLFDGSEPDYLLRLPLATTRHLTSVSCSATTWPQDAAFSTCVAYCDALDRKLLHE